MVGKGPKNSGKDLPPPLFGQCQKENIFFFRRAFLTSDAFGEIGTPFLQTRRRHQGTGTVGHRGTVGHKDPS